MFLFLLQCLVQAHKVNSQFQSDMKNLFGQSKIYKCQFESAKVKDFERCVIKCQTKYAHKPFPSQG